MRFRQAQTSALVGARMVNSLLIEDDSVLLKADAMTQIHDIVFLFDVDNTLLDNDRVQAHLSEHLAENYGVAARDRYWEILRELVDELGYNDYLGALERYRIEALHRPDLLRMSS